MSCSPVEKMIQQNNEPEMRIVGVLVLTVILLALSFVVGLSINKTHPTNEPEIPMTLASLSETDLAAPANETQLVAEVGVVKFYFNTGKSVLAPGAQEALAAIATAAQSGQKFTISGFHDATGGDKVNAKLAQKRAQAVRQALLKAGVPASSMVIQKPKQMPKDSNRAESRRVEVAVRP
jgi:outer membrane protein OmpA-like peptidoglycan-associated protein